MFDSFFKTLYLRFNIFVRTRMSLWVFIRWDPECEMIKPGNAALFSWQAVKSLIKK